MYPHHAVSKTTSISCTSECPFSKPCCAAASGELQNEHVCDTNDINRKRFDNLFFFSQPSAFWGESDESSSELEAALCPQAHSTEADEFDDFYD